MFWTIFSICYFSLNIFLQTLPQEDERKNTIKLLIFLALMFRNISTLFATTMYSIYSMIRHPDRAYPKNLEGKLEALDFDLVL